MFQDDGASTEVTGTFVSSNALMTAGNGSRTSPEKLKPDPLPKPCRQQSNSASFKFRNVSSISSEREARNSRRTKNSINNMISRLKSLREVVDKGDIQILQLL